MSDEDLRSIKKTLDDATIRLQKISEQLVEVSAMNKIYHAAFDQLKVKVEVLEQNIHKAQGSASVIRWLITLSFGSILAYCAWFMVAVNELKQDVVIIQSKFKED